MIIELILTSPFQNLIVAITGLACGVLLNYLADVLPYRRKLVWPLCLVCGQKQTIFNYFIWPRRCAECLAARSRRTWLVELGMIIASVLLWIDFDASLGYMTRLLLLAFFCLVTIIDLEHRLILHVVSFPGALFGIILGVSQHGWISTLGGGLAGFLAMLALYNLGAVLMKWLARKRGKELTEDALGFGDVIFSGVLGLFLGWPGIIAGLVLAILLAGGVSLIYLMVMVFSRRYRSDLSIAYGPYLVVSGVILLLF